MTRRLKILHIGNGRSFKIKAVVDASLQRGHEVHMVPVPPVVDGWADVTWHCLASPALLSTTATLVRFLQVRHLARRLQPDVIHAHNACGPGWYGAFTGLHPFIIHGYGGDLLPEHYVGRPKWQRYMTSWACRSADRIIVTGRHMVDASQGFGFPKDRVLVLSRGVDLEHFRPGLTTRPLRDSLGLGAAAPIIFSPRYQVDEALYNLDSIIDAFAQVKRRFPAAVCLQMFDPQRQSGRARLERLAADRGLGASYRLVPCVDNEAMPLYYNLADAVVSVPTTDGFPVTVLEASACAAALVVSRLPYCDEWFADRENGLMVEVGDTMALADAISALAGDPALRQRLGEASRRLVADRADRRSCMDALEHEYQALSALGRTRARRA